MLVILRLSGAGSDPGVKSGLCCLYGITSVTIRLAHLLSVFFLICVSHDHLRGRFSHFVFALNATQSWYVRTALFICCVCGTVTRFHETVEKYFR